MINDILFIFLIFLIYSHNLSNLGFEEVLIRVILFGVSIKYYYLLEPFSVNCYPDSYEAKTNISYDSDLKGWCEDNEPDNAAIIDGDIGAEGRGAGGSSQNKSDECVFGTEALPSYSAASNSKAWCVQRL